MHSKRLSQRICRVNSGWNPRLVRSQAERFYVKFAVLKAKKMKHRLFSFCLGMEKGAVAIGGVMPQVSEYDSHLNRRGCEFESQEPRCFIL
jgi:hypothetical protein